jgi:hypothetical protein
MAASAGLAVMTAAMVVFSRLALSGPVWITQFLGLPGGLLAELRSFSLGQSG